MSWIGVALVYAWRYSLGLLTPAGTCKYHPSCSEYTIQAINQYGPLSGAARGVWRICRCNPWSRGGFDPP